MNNKNLNEILKQREALEQKAKAEQNNSQNKPLALDDTQRVKVLSPGRLVAKRFFKNKLAIFGLAILILMFIFSFIGPLFYPYSQTDIFYKYDYLTIDYANAAERTDAVAYALSDSAQISSKVKNSLNSYIKSMEKDGKTEAVITDDDGTQYSIQKLGEKIYSLSADQLTETAKISQNTSIAKYNRFSKKISWNSGITADDGLQKAIENAVSSKSSDFEYNGISYSIKSESKNMYNIIRNTPEIKWSGENLGDDFIALAMKHSDGTKFTFNGADYRAKANDDSSVSVSAIGGKTIVSVLSSLVFNVYDKAENFSDQVKAGILLSIYDSGKFSYNGKTYSVTKKDSRYEIYDESNNEIASLGNFVIKRYSGQDTLSFDFKEKAQQTIYDMLQNNQTSSKFVYSLPQMDLQGNYVLDENGNTTYADAEITVTKKNNQYVLTCEQVTYLIDIFGRPSSKHIFGTDGDGMDILARMMYGGHISLIVGFIVVFLEVIIGVILGGIAGYFSGWVDTVIMRLVDIFYCIPSLPILIIMGAFFDAIKMNPYERLAWLMVILGILGWAGVARLVRGQILSLREQEFMIAQEATGIKASRRIFRHLVPNIMPQLIVNATMGLGSVIILESTLSFLGLGVKHPLATWGTMINSVASSSENMIKYAYIWIPVGLLICLTVIAFNFVGDGLRDAFDPKMKQ